MLSKFGDFVSFFVNAITVSHLDIFVYSETMSSEKIEQLLGTVIFLI